MGGSSYNHDTANVIRAVRMGEILQAGDLIRILRPFLIVLSVFVFILTFVEQASAKNFTGRRQALYLTVVGQLGPRQVEEDVRIQIGPTTKIIRLNRQVRQAQVVFLLPSAGFYQAQLTSSSTLLLGDGTMRRVGAVGRVELRLNSSSSYALIVDVKNPSLIGLTQIYKNPAPSPPQAAPPSPPRTPTAVRPAQAYPDPSPSPSSPELDPVWVTELPPVKTVKASVRGQTPTDTLAQQDAAFSVMQAYISVRSGRVITMTAAREGVVPDAQRFKGVSPLAAQRFEEYFYAQTQPLTIFDRRLSPAAEAYANNRKFHLAVISRLLSQEAVNAYQQGSMRQVMDSFRESISGEQELGFGALGAMLQATAAIEVIGQAAESPAISDYSPSVQRGGTVTPMQEQQKWEADKRQRLETCRRNCESRKTYCAMGPDYNNCTNLSNNNVSSCQFSCN